MKRIVLVSLVLANIGLLGALWLRAPRTLEASDGLYDCCQSETSGGLFCCSKCCWNPFGSECKSNTDCGKTIKNP